MTPPSLSRRLALCAIALAPLALAGCGRKADAEPPQDRDPKAPRIYPVDRRRGPSAPSDDPAFQPPVQTPDVFSPRYDPLAPLSLPPPEFR